MATVIPKDTFDDHTVEYVHRLLFLGASPNVCSGDVRTPIAYAFVNLIFRTTDEQRIKSITECLRLAIQAGADVTEVRGKSLKKYTTGIASFYVRLTHDPSRVQTKLDSILKLLK